MSDWLISRVRDRYCKCCDKEVAIRFDPGYTYGFLECTCVLDKTKPARAGLWHTSQVSALSKCSKIKENMPCIANILNNTNPRYFHWKAHSLTLIGKYSLSYCLVREIHSYPKKKLLSFCQVRRFRFPRVKRNQEVWCQWRGFDFPRK